MPNFHHVFYIVFTVLRFDWLSFILLTFCLYDMTGELVPPTVYLEATTPNIRIKVVDGNMHKFAYVFLVVFFFQILSKFS